MDKHAIITAVAIAVIATPLAVSAANIAGAEQMQYRWDSPGMFSFFKMATGGSLEFCNTVPFWTSIERFEVTVYYHGKDVGTYTAGPISMDPLASDVYEGTFRSEQVASSHQMFMTVDFGISNGEFRIDPGQIVLTTTTYTPILGLIPYQATSQMSALEFDRAMRAADLACD